MGQMDGSAKSGKRGNIILFYLVIGPPIGGLLLLLYWDVAVLFSPGFEFWAESFASEPVQSMLRFFGSIVFVTLMSYVYGGVQAMLTGLLIAVASGPDGKFSYALALIAPAVVGIVVMILLVVGAQLPIEFGVFLGGIGVSTSLLIRFLFRRRFGKA